jgi:hypothetical protein
VGERCSTPWKYEKRMQHLVAKLKEKRPFGRTRLTYKGKTEIDVKGIGCMNVDEINVFLNTAQ